MKKFVSLLLCVLLLASFPACSSEEKTPLEGVTGIGVYTDFINNVTSGELLKLYYSFDTWYDFCNSTSTNIVFKENEEGKRELLYRDRDMFVFWHYPPYDYYDGNTYYYKYRDEWYTDSFTKYHRVQEGDFIGIRDNFFSGNNVLSDVVYKKNRGYEAKSIIQTPSKSIYYEMTGKLDKDFNFSHIIIYKFRYDYEKSAYIKMGTYFFRYTRVNQVKEIKRPKDLVLADIEQNPEQ